MTFPKSIGVFCGSQLGKNPQFAEAARDVAYAFAKADITLVYGGAKVGIMGVIADEMVNLKGKVIGVMPKHLVDREIAHPGITDLRIVNSMHERKSLIAELVDGFLMLPGATGTLDEFVEVLTWAQLGLHQKPCAILNAANYYDYLLKFLDHTVAMEFLNPAYRDMIIVENSPEKIIEAFVNYQPPAHKWAK